MKSDCDRNSSKHKDYTLKLFVAGLPSRINVIAVQDYFNRFGDVKITTCSHSNRSGLKITNPLENLKNGCCIVETYDNITRDKILRCVTHLFYGRTLQVSQYRTGSDLIQHNLNLNKRRVIVKKVPKIISELILRSFLEDQIGAVQSIYKYKAQCPSSQKSRELRQHFNTFSVVFFRRESAELAASRAKQHFSPGVDLVIERFQRAPMKPTQLRKNKEEAECNIIGGLAWSSKYEPQHDQTAFQKFSGNEFTNANSYKSSKLIPSCSNGSQVQAFRVASKESNEVQQQGSMSTSEMTANNISQASRNTYTGYEEDEEVELLKPTRLKYHAGAHIPHDDVKKMQDDNYRFNQQQAQAHRN